MWRSVRRGLRLLVYAGCALVVLYAIWGMWLVFSQPGWNYQQSLIDVSGARARRALKHWPVEVDPAKVHHVHLWSAGGLDWHVRLIRMQTDSDSASAWSDAMERTFTQTLIQMQDRGREVEAIERRESERLDLPQDVPSWWTDGQNTPRTTKINKAIAWYRDSESGVGMLTGVQYDRESQTLWILERSIQHWQLWKRGQPPDADAIWDAKEREWLPSNPSP